MRRDGGRQRQFPADGSRSERERMEIETMTMTAAAADLDLDHPTPVISDGCDRARRLIAHRCPELTDLEVAAAFAGGLPVGLVDDIAAVLDALAEKLDAIEAKLPQEDDE